ncbi:hypothetical protein D3C83_18810 [compost metagenome]
MGHVRPAFDAEFFRGKSPLEAGGQILQRLGAVFDARPHDAVVPPVLDAIHVEAETLCRHSGGQSFQSRQAIAGDVAQKYQREMDIAGGGRLAAALALQRLAEVAQRALDFRSGPCREEEPRRVRLCQHRKLAAKAPWRLGGLAAWRLF